MELKPIIRMKKNLSDEVKENLSDYISRIDVNKNPKLPSEAALAQILGVSRVTIRRALDDLEQSGLLLRIHGRGTFVNPEAVQIKLNMTEGGELMESIIRSGYEAKVELVRVEEYDADKNIALALQIEPGVRIVEIEKVFYADSHPAIVCIDRFPKDILLRPLKEEEYKRTIFELLRDTAGKIITRDKVEVLSMSKAQMKKHSPFADQMECDSVLVLNSINYDQNNIPIIFDTEFYNTNYIRYTLLRPKNIHYV